MSRLHLRILMRRGRDRGSRLGGDARGAERTWSISGGVVVRVGWLRIAREWRESEVVVARWARLGWYFKWDGERMSQDCKKAFDHVYSTAVRQCNGLLRGVLFFSVAFGRKRCLGCVCSMPFTCLRERRVRQGKRAVKRSIQFFFARSIGIEVSTNSLFSHSHRMKSTNEPSHIYTFSVYI